MKKEIKRIAIFCDHCNCDFTCLQNYINKTAYREALCSKCEGLGHVPDIETVKCLYCDGSGACLVQKPPLEPYTKKVQIHI